MTHANRRRQPIHPGPFTPNSKSHSTVRTYGVLVGTVKDGVLQGPNKSPHYEILVDAGGQDYRIAVNVLSSDESEVMVYLDHDFNSTLPKNLDLETLAGSQGFKKLKDKDSSDFKGIDYLRDNLFPVDKMESIPPYGSVFSMHNILDGLIMRAVADSEAVVIAFGQSFGDEGYDDTFHFRPERGTHDIHMMQGNPPGPHWKDNRAHGDGALFLRFKGGETVALFVRFSSQDVSTDNSTEE